MSKATPKPNSKIVYPTVPDKEKDPHVRINVMIGQFNASLPPRETHGKINQGLYHEIATALVLVRKYKVTRGNQISRSLTAAEAKAGKNGTDQMIKVPMEGKNFRELDMVYEENGKPVIVEAKNKKTTDASQLKINTELAQTLGGRLVYALEGLKAGQQKALQAAYDKLAKTKNHPMPGLEVVSIPFEKFAELYFEGWVAGLETIATLEAIMDNNFNPDTGEEWDL